MLPVLVLHLFWRGLRQRDYWRHWSERFSGGPPVSEHQLPGWLGGARDPDQAVLWIHAVSVGETRAAAPLIDRWLAQSDRHVVLLTHTTPTGRATGADLFARWLTQPAPRLVQRYLPYDFSWANHRFLTSVRPTLGVLMETELWPNLLAQARALRLPVALINARLSPRSRERLRRFRWLSRPAVAGLVGIAAQTSRDAQGFEAVLMLSPKDSYARPRIEILGNMKFDVDIPESMRALGQQWRTLFISQHAQSAGDSSRIWAAVSTREDEESALLDAWLAARREGRLTLRDHLLIVPRHPQRFERVAQLIRERGLMVCCRSQDWSAPDMTQPAPTQLMAARDTVWLGDSLGEMFAYLQMADIVLIGGSVKPLGGQNPLEACALGRPVFFGPHMFNFYEIARELKSCGAGVEVIDAADWITRGLQLLKDDAQMSKRAAQALAFSQLHRGATARTEVFLNAILQAAR
ncbi:MAG: 3-deoxy-D-manno-octulosonic acid transferase [Burkholderiaceae bacterium]|nr:3-deoxy-D-manno-octulosonic acid transferase [Burkholderiaceae bacterium]